MGFASVPPGEAERRIRSRWKPASLLYVELDGGNGGVVLNISETGLGIHAAQTVLEDAVSSLRFKLPPSREKIVARGQIAWKGDTRKELGVRFVDLPETTRLEIRRWIQADSVPRRLPEKVRPFPLNRVRRAATPAAPAPCPAQPLQASADAGQARYPISTAMAYALREAREAQRSAAAQASCAASPPAIPVASTPARTAGSEAERTLAQPAVSARGGSTIQAAPPAARAPTAASPVAGRPLIPAVLPLDPEAPSARGRAAAAHAAPRHQHAGLRKGLLLGAAVTLLAFFLGLEVGARGLVLAWHELSAGWVNAWRIAGEYLAVNQGKEPPAIPAPKKAEPGTVLPAPARSEKAEAGPPADGQPSKPLVSPAASNSAARLHASGGTPRAVTRNKSLVRSASLPAAPGEDGPVLAPNTPAATHTVSPQQGPAAEQAPSSEHAPGPELPPALMASTEGISGAVVVHSRLRTIRIPTELRLLNSSVGDGLQVGELLSGDPPAYPQEALRDRVEGTVDLRAVVGRDGAMASVAVVKGPAPFVAPAVEAVRGWRYEPTLLWGQAVEWEEDITLVFRLQNPPAAQE